MATDHELYSFIYLFSLVLFLLPLVVSFTPAQRRWTRIAAAIVLAVGVIIALFQTALWYVGPG